MIDFSTLQALTVPEGVVTKIEKDGVVLWELPVGGSIVLEVEKITSNTYAGSTQYNNETFILLDIYPRSGGTVTVTYGGLTKTITDDGTSEEPNAQQVFFGTFNGVSDEVETPASGTLTIEGDCRGFGCGSYEQSSKGFSVDCSCITNVSEWESIEIIPQDAFSDCDKITSIIIPDGVTKIGKGSFRDCGNLSDLFIPSSVENVGEYGTAIEDILNNTTFMNCKKLVTLVVDVNNPYFSAENSVLFNKDKTRLYAYPTISGSYIVPDTVTEIGNCACYDTAVTDVTIPSGVTIIHNSAFYNCSKIKTFNILATTPPKIAGDIFGTLYVPTIYVPAGCGDAYKAADGWSDYADKIMEVS